MKLTTPICPTCDQPAVSITEKILCYVEIRVSGDGTVEYTEKKEIDWGSQQLDFGPDDSVVSVTCGSHYWDSRYKSFKVAP